MNNSITSAEKVPTLSDVSSLELFVEHVDRVKSDPDGKSKLLLPLLSEQHPIYKDRSTSEQIRMRGYAMAALEVTGVPRQALPYILEALESEFHPYLVAAAAKALQGVRVPHPAIAPFLIKAIYNIWENDKPVSFESYRVKWPQENFSTGLTEIFEALAHFGGYAKQVIPELENLYHLHADKFSATARSKLIQAIDAIKSDQLEVDTGCCNVSLELLQGQELDEDRDICEVPHDLNIQDQDGVQIQWSEFFLRKPTVLAFFYTRCMNPRKCTQTIFNLAGIREELTSRGLSDKVQVAAISYDPKFDTPEALKSFGDARGFQFDDDTRMFRIPQGFEQVVNAFNLGVNFTGSQVNSHRIELFLLDENGKVVRSFLRIQSDPKQVIEAVGGMVSSKNQSKQTGPHDHPILPAERKTGDRLQAAASIFLSFIMVFFPKCPMCWVSYMSLLGIVGAESIPYSPWLLPVIIGLLLLNLLLMYRGAPSRNGYLPVSFSLMGSILLALAIPQIGIVMSIIPGFALLLTGSLLQSLSYAKFKKLELLFREFQIRFFLKRSSAFSNVAANSSSETPVTNQNLE